MVTARGKGKYRFVRRLFLAVWGTFCSAVVAFALVIHVWACNREFLEQQMCILPCEIAGCDLVAEQLLRYDGPFFENGSREEVTDVAALILRNAGEEGVEAATIFLFQEGNRLVFEATQIPPGAAVLVLERDCKLYTGEPLVDCSGFAEKESTGWFPNAFVAIQNTDMGSISVMNRTDQHMQGIRLYYKTAYEGGLFYLGGITYETEIGELAPGEHAYASPEHYASGSSKIVRVLFETKTAPLNP